MASLFDFQRQAVSELLAGKHIICSGCGSGKSAVSMVWAEQKCKETGKHKVLVVTTASKRKARTDNGDDDFTADARLFCSSSFSNSLSSSLSLISWHKLSAWVDANWNSLEEYVVIFDECLPADTLVKTNAGEKEIANLSVGDKVLSYNHDTHKLEYKKITRTIKKSSPNKMIRLRLANGTAIISTGNHPHFTQDGYKNAEDIKTGDRLYEVFDLRERNNKEIDSEAKTQSKEDRQSLLFNRLRARICGDGSARAGTKSQRTEAGDKDIALLLLPERSNSRRNAEPPVPALSKEPESVLLPRARRCMERGEGYERGGKCQRSKMGEDCAVLRMRGSGAYSEYDESSAGIIQQKKNSVLLDRVLEESNCEKSQSVYDPSQRRDLGADEEVAIKPQLVEHRGEQAKSASDKKEKRMATNMGNKARIKRWQWETFRATKDIMEEAKRGEQRVGSRAGGESRGKDRRLPNLLQTGYRKCVLQDRYRMRWGWAQRGQSEGKRQEEREEVRGVRVESVEVLELGDIKRLRLYRDPDNVYCIDVEDNHNFFANGILTHNCQKSKSGISSQMGKAFLKLTKRNPDWAGFTGTPGDTWLSFYAYFTACGLVRNKTSFLSEYANIQTYKGFPEIIGWRNEGKLKQMWASISYAPDTSKVMAELPKETYKTVKFSTPSAYAKVLKTRFRAGSDGTDMDDFLDTPGALTSELRRICFTKDKQEWVKDFVENLESGCVMFYNYIATGDKLEEIIKKALPEGGKVWRIDGSHHDIPTAETIGKKDVVLCQWQSGSEALNLQFLHYMVIVELCYSYSTFTQGLGRIKRVGQKNPMSFYLLICDKGIEQDVLDIVRAKGEFSTRNWCLGKGINLKGGEE